LAPAAKNTVMTHCWEQLAALLSSGAAPHMLSAALGVRSLPGCGGADSAPPQLLLTAQVSVTETGLQLLVSLFAAPTAAPAMTASWPEWTHRPQSGTGGTTWQDTQIQVLTAAAAAAATWPVQQASIRGYRWTHCRLWLLLLQRRLPVAKSSAAAAARLKTPWLQAHRSRARPAQDTDD
jgi:hypothetical protein